MPISLIWDEPRTLSELRAGDIEDGGVPFVHGGYLYQSTGLQLGQGGMGTAYELFRRPLEQADALEQTVAKVFHEEYLYQLRTDPVTRKDHRSVLTNIRSIAQLGHPHILPTLLSEPIADNYLNVTPRKADTLNALIAQNHLSARQRLELLIQALEGASAMHQQGFIHRDITLRNILVDHPSKNAFLFDFDLALSVEEVGESSYKERYQGRIFGSPGYSVAPEVLDAKLMDLEISSALDIYAIGSAVFCLFTDQLPYGPTEDMWGLLLRIAEGVVLGRESRVVYPESVPKAVRPIIEGCLERNPNDRYRTVNDVIGELRAISRQLPDDRYERSAPVGTLRYGIPKSERVHDVVKRRRDVTVTESLIRNLDGSLATHGYEIQRSLGRVKGHPIFLAVPIPELVAIGRFHDSNTYPKIVTVVDLRQVSNEEELVERWLGDYLPVLTSARRGLLTTLYRVVHDDDSRCLFLFSEYVDDARFGQDIAEVDLTLQEAFCLGYLVGQQVQTLHNRGIAHNNVAASSLLLKGIRLTRMVRPAMVGLVDPSMNAADMKSDVRRLAELTADWVRQTRIEAADEIARARLVELWSSLKKMTKASDEEAGIEHLVELMADGLSTIDFNFGVLRENGGDLVEYALLLMSTRLFGRLWG